MDVAPIKTKEGPQFRIQRYRPTEVRRFSFNEMQEMAKMVVQSRLFRGITDVSAAMTLMLLCDAENLHPIQALRRYDIIDGRPALKSEAMLADFQARGGKVRWIEISATACEAEFMSQGLAEPVKVRWTLEDARRAGLTGKQNWIKYPTDMLKARVVSRGVRLADPAIAGGLYPPEEVMDFDDRPKKADAEIVDPGRLPDGDQEQSPGPAKLGGGPPPGPPHQDAAEQRVREARAYAAEASARSNELTDKILERLKTPTTSEEIAHHADLQGKTAHEKITEIARLAQATFAPADPETERLLQHHPEKCPHPGCGMPLWIYKSTQEKHLNRRYAQCQGAHDEILRLIAEENVTPEDAARAMSQHYRRWAEIAPPAEKASRTSKKTSAPSSTGDATDAPPF